MWTQFAFKDRWKYAVKINILNITYPNQKIDIERSYWSRNHFIVPHTLNFTFNLDIESTDKTRSIANKLDGALVKKKVLFEGH